ARASIRRREGATYTLSVTTSQGVTQTEFDPESREVLRLSLSRPAFVTVRIEGYEDHPNRADFVVDVRKAGSEPPQGIDFLHRRMMGDENQQGRRHGPYEPGEYSIALLLTMDTPPYAHVLDSAELALAAGDNTITLTAPALHSVTVEIPKEYRTDRLELRHMHDGDYYVRQRNSGSAEFKAEGLKPGVYHLSDGSTGAMRINIPADSGRTIPFNPQPFDAVWIVGRMMGRQDPDFALKSGDVVHSIDGKTIASVKEFYDAISAARKNESAMCVL